MVTMSCTIAASQGAVSSPSGQYPWSSTPTCRYGAPLSISRGTPCSSRLHRHRAQPHVGGDPVLAEDHLDVVEVRVLGGPGAHVAHREPGRGVGGHHAAGARERHRRLAGCRVHGHLDAAVGEVRHQVEPGDVHGRDRLEPDRLPDARLGGVPDAAARQPLLAGGVLLPVGAVANVERQLAAAAAERVGDVAGEGQVATHVAADLDTVHADRAGLVHGAEVQQQPAAGGHEPVRHLHGAAVAEPLVGAELPAHPRQRRLGGEGHQDRPVVHLGRRCVCGRDRVVPPAVEVQVAVPDQLRARVLDQHLRRVERTAPAGEQLLSHPVILAGDPSDGQPPPGASRLTPWRGGGARPSGRCRERLTR